MKKFHALLAIYILFTIVLSACGIATPPPTATAEPSDTPLPTLTYTPIPTNTPIPTDTPTLEPTLALAEPKIIKEGGYSFQPPVGYELNIQGGQVGISEETGRLIISIYGATSNPQNLSQNEIVEQFISSVFKKGNGEYSKGVASPIEVDGVAGFTYEITGTLFDAPLRGQAIIVMPSGNQYLFGLGVANTEENKTQWEDQGSKVFSTLINSITFLTSEQTDSGDLCTISTDNTYGYSKENPIKVGGDAFDGPPRERAYLDNLAGPKGEKISYKRNGSIDSGDTILDDFAITGLSKQVTLYIDEYSYDELKAPVGFTCLSTFPAKP